MKHENYLIKKDESIFYKIRQFFKNIFSKNCVNQVKDVIIKESENDEKFLESLKVDNLNGFENITNIEDFIKKIKSNPELLDKLSDERLDKLIEYYENRINEKFKLLNYSCYLD